MNTNDVLTKLKAEIERQQRKLLLLFNTQHVDLRRNYAIQNGVYVYILSIIESLQQEQPDFPTTDEEMEMFLATHPKVEVPDKYKTPDWLWKKLEHPGRDLEKEFNDFLDNVEGVPRMCRYDELIEWAKVIACHFAEWGAIHLNARNE